MSEKLRAKVEHWLKHQDEPLMVTRAEAAELDAYQALVEHFLMHENVGKFNA